MFVVLVFNAFADVQSAGVDMRGVFGGILWRQQGGMLEVADDLIEHGCDFSCNETHEFH